MNFHHFNSIFLFSDSVHRSSSTPVERNRNHIMNCLIKIIFLASISAIALGAGYLPEPTNIKADVSSTGVALSWDAVEGANGYMVIMNCVPQPR